MLVLAVLAFLWDAVPVAVLALMVAVLAGFNVGFVQFRRRERAREEPDADHSLFE
jgi:hypothetical protein